MRSEDGTEPFRKPLSGPEELIRFHTITTVIGSICVGVNVLLLFVFLTSRYLRGKYQILITLAIADFMNCLGIMSMGINRVQLYSGIVETQRIPIRNSWTCAAQVWLWLRVIGDLWPPTVQVIMGVERVLAVFVPIWYRHRTKTRTYVLILATGLFVFISLAVGFVIASVNREHKTRFFCGRKETFSFSYGTFIYATNVIGYLTGCILNVTAYIRVKTTMQVTRQSKSQMERLRYHLMISFLSTILVCIPNIISLTSSWIGKVSDAISKPSVWATCVNSGLNFFVYLTLNTEFRMRVKSIVHCNWDESTAARAHYSTVRTRESPPNDKEKTPLNGANGKAEDGDKKKDATNGNNF